MDGTILPTVRVPVFPVHAENGEGIKTEVPLVELPSSEKFGFAWPSDTSPVATAPLGVVEQRPGHETTDFDSTESDSLVSQESSPRMRNVRDLEPTDHTPTADSPTDTMSTRPPMRSRLSRAFSMPLPSQLNHLKNPRRSGAVSTRSPFSPPIVQADENSAFFHDFSLELADSVQMVIQTLLQISPPQLLDPAKEQFAPCALSIPSPSISAVLTAMKNLNYMSANILDIERITVDTALEPEVFPEDDFDIGELLQSVGDTLSGVAAQAGVDLVLYHADVGMKHVSVSADECGMSFVLSHIIRQVISTAHRGDTIEIGLFISAESPLANDASVADVEHAPLSPSSSTNRLSDAPISSGRWIATFDVAHKFKTMDGMLGSYQEMRSSSPDARAVPQFESQNVSHVFKRMQATFTSGLEPRLFPNGRSCEIVFPVKPGSPDVLRVSTPNDSSSILDEPFANEPTLEELQFFVETLRGKKVALHASAKGSFAHHLTSYLTTWGLDVSHMSQSVFQETDMMPVEPVSPNSIHSIAEEGSLPSIVTQSPSPEPSSAPLDDLTTKPTVGGPPAFIIIDDDIVALHQRLMQMRVNRAQSLNQRGQRPLLAAHHRPRSSSQVAKSKGVHSIPHISEEIFPVIVHFTSMGNFKLVRDVLQTVLSSKTQNNKIPEVIVIPKPAGPRRFLTALRTALLKPVVDPFFAPIATSPMSPNVHNGTLSPFFSRDTNNNTSNLSRRPSRPSPTHRSSSDRSSKSSSNTHATDVSHPAPPSPLGKADNLEYFEEAALKLGASPSSGLVIQSPDGSPAGIFFQPRGATPKNPLGGSDSSRKEGKKNGSSNTPAVIHDVGNLRITPASSISRAASHLRHRDSHAKYPSVESVTAGQADATPILPPSSLKAKGRGFPSPPAEERTAQPKDGFSPPPSQPTTPLHTSPPAQKSADGAYVRATGSPPHSPSTRAAPSSSGVTVSKRASARRSTGDASSSVSSSKKPRANGESNIVPPINVLIVEDNPINQTILSTFMRRKKIKYEVAKNGEEAVQKWSTGEYHLILMDIQMPVMDGIEATKQIRRLERQEALGFPSTPSDGQKTPSEQALESPSMDSDRRSMTSNTTPFKSSVIIVALTASSLESDRVAALAAGCNDFLTKPVSLHWLNSKIIEWGSIKALQMWADLRPEVANSISHEQAAQADDVASKLHMPSERRSGAASRAQSRSASRSSANRRPMIRRVSQEEVPIQSSLSTSSLSTLVPTAEQSEPTEHVLDIFPNPSVSQVAGLTDEEEHSSSFVHSQDELDVHADSDSAPSELEDLSQSPVSSPRPVPSRVVSGRDALLAHLQDSKEEADTFAHRTDDDPVVLGQRTLNAGNISIAEVLHPTGETSGDILKEDNPTKTVKHSDLDVVNSVEKNDPAPQSSNAELRLPVNNTM